MTRGRALALATAMTAGCALVLAMLGAGAVAEPSAPQELFRTTLLDDPSTTPAVKRELNTRAGIIAPEIQFADLTGDGRSDAIVFVETGGVGGAVALYVLSTDGKDATSPLRVVYRSQQLYAASATVSGATLVLHTPRFVEGDDVCCPDKLVERVYTWSKTAGTLRQTSTQELEGPVQGGTPGATTTTPAPTPG